MTAKVGTPRRYYLLSRLAARERHEFALEGAWQAKQEAEPGTPLPADFPLLSKLKEHGYTTQEDLTGADECELTDVEFTRRESEAILAAFANL